MKLFVEIDSKSKAKQLFTAPNSKSHIKTFAIFTAENPDKKRLSNKDNVKLNKSLKKEIGFDTIDKTLNLGHFPYYKVKGSYGSVEHSFLVYNIALGEAKSLAEKFHQQSFVFGKNKDGKLYFEMWANKYASGYKYALIDEKDYYIDATDAEDYYTQISKNFKINIPFNRFEFGLDELEEHLKNSLDEDIEDLLSESVDDSINGRDRYTARIILYK